MDHSLRTMNVEKQLLRFAPLTLSPTAGAHKNFSDRLIFLPLNTDWKVFFFLKKAKGKSLGSYRGEPGIRLDPSRPVKLILSSCEKGMAISIVGK